MKQRPILFSMPMVQAILKGDKTQTRRVVKHKLDDRGVRTTNVQCEDWHGQELKCPYGQPGDLLWVRETWRYFKIKDTSIKYNYKAKLNPDVDKALKFFSIKWNSSIFMPKDAARIWLRITNVRVERLQDINRKEAILEGFPFPNKLDGEDPKKWFSDLWQSINGEQSWNANPWVWVVEFKRIEKPASDV